MCDEEIEEAKRAAESAAQSGGQAAQSGSTPDYAVGLTSLNPATPQPTIYTPTTATTARQYP